MYKLTQLENGVRVATATMPHMSSVSLGFWVAVGGRFEPEESAGVAHFIEHLLFKGTKRRSAKEISQAVEGVGGYLNAFTAEEHTCFYAKASASRFEDIFEVLSDMFVHSRFDPVEIEKERGVIKEELAMYLDQPHHHVQELLNETLWPGHALGRSLIGTEKTLDAMNRTGLVDFFQANYVAPSLLIVAAGNVAHEDLVGKARRLARNIKPGKRPRLTPVRPEQAKPRLRVLRKKTEQAQLALGFRACSRHDEKRFALRVLNTILGENMSSRLFQTVREENGLAYSIYSSLSFFEDTGCLSIAAGLDVERLPKAVRLICSELKKVREIAPSPTELKRARDYLIGQLEMSLEGTENQMMWVGEHTLGYGKPASAAWVKDRLAEVTRSDIRAAARDVISGDRLSAALISAASDDAGLSRTLKV